jgi:lipoprotein-anchoring transpeptidase ErfK/SrfK
MIRNKTLLWGLFITLLAIPTFLSLYYYIKLEESKRYAKFIIIEKDTRQLTIFDYQGIKLAAFEVGIGLNPGNKIKQGDMRTPEGVFPIVRIEEASTWEYDFKDDDVGPIKGAYGPWFLRLNVSDKELFSNSLNEREFTTYSEFKGIGIHGTHDNSSIGTRVSKGCIRMRNHELEIIKQHAYIGMQVVILPSLADVTENYNPAITK